MSDSTHRAPHSTFKVAADGNEFYMPMGTEKMVHDKYKEWVKRRALSCNSSTLVKLYPKSKFK